MFIVRLKKIKEGGNIVQMKGRFKLEAEYKKKLLKDLQKGKPGHRIHKSAATMKKKKGQAVRSSTQQIGRKSTKPKSKSSS